MSEKTQVAYTQYIKNAIERVRALKDEGHDVTECNRLLQSLVAAVLDDDSNCADFLIGELENAMQKIEVLRPASETLMPGAVIPKTLPVGVEKITGLPGPDDYRIVITRKPLIEKQKREQSILIIGLIYSLLILFAGTVVTLILYVLRMS